MLVELTTWRPLWDFSAGLVVLGLAGCLSARDRTGWWLSHGMMVLGVIVGLAGTSSLHVGIDLFSLGAWVPVVLLLEAIVFTLAPAARQAAEATQPCDQADNPMEEP